MQDFLYRGLFFTLLAGICWGAVGICYSKGTEKGESFYPFMFLSSLAVAGFVWISAPPEAAPRNEILAVAGVMLRRKPDPARRRAAERRCGGRRHGKIHPLDIACICSCRNPADSVHVSVENVRLIRRGADMACSSVFPDRRNMAVFSVRERMSANASGMETGAGLRGICLPRTNLHLLCY